MPSVCNLDEFVDLIRKCGVMEGRRLESYLQQLRAQNALPDDPEELAEIMIQQGLMSRFQAEPLLQNKPRRFVIAGKYKLIDRLGAGGMASVYLCEHRIMRRRVAIKVLPLAMAKNPAALERFHREARASASLDHPNIVRAHDVDADGPMHFLVIEYVEGISLQDLVKRKGPLNPTRAANYIAQSAQGLQHAHLMGLVHRDIKPANLLIDRTGTLKILDLGLALFFHDDSDDLTKQHDTSAVLGTADYLAPEQGVDSHNVDIRADIYSLGITFYYLLTGQTPFGNGTVAQKLVWHHMRPPQPPRELRPEIPVEMEAVLLKMIAKSPDDRYQTPEEVATALATWRNTPIPVPADDEMPKQMLPISFDSPVSEINLSSVALPSPLDSSVTENRRKPVAPGDSDRTDRMSLKPIIGGGSSLHLSASGKSKSPAAPSETRARKSDETPSPKSPTPPRTNPKPTAPTTSTRSGTGSKVAAAPVVAEVVEEVEVVDAGLSNKKKNKKKNEEERKAKQKQQELMATLATCVLALLTAMGGALVYAMRAEDPNVNEIVVVTPQIPVPPQPAPKPAPLPQPAPVTQPQPAPQPPKPETKPEPKNVEPPKVEVVVGPPKPMIDPMMPPTPVEEPKVTAAFFYPASVEKPLTYDFAQLAGNVMRVTRYRFDFTKPGQIDPVPIRWGALTDAPLLSGGNPTWFTRPPNVAKPSPIYYRVGKEFVEMGSGKDINKVVFEPILKIGAKVGETWKFQLPSTDTRVYVVESFTKHRDRNAVMIKSTEPASGGEIVSITTFVEKVGEVERRRFFQKTVVTPPAGNTPPAAAGTTPGQTPPLVAPVVQPGVPPANATGGATTPAKPTYPPSVEERKLIE